jgi:hypothetical protein
MNDIYKKLNISQSIINNTKAQRKPKGYTKVKNQVFPKQDYNFMADLLFLPKTKEGYRYLLVVVDLWSDEFDIEPLKTKQAKETLQAFKRMTKRPYLNFPKASIATDEGSEFKGAFHKHIFDNNIYHKFAVPKRKTQQSQVESLNRTLGRLINRYLAQKEVDEGHEVKDWLPTLDIIRKNLNKIRKKPDGDPFELKESKWINTREPKFKKGDMVHWFLDAPETFTSRALNDTNFREGDRRVSLASVKVKRVLPYDNKNVPFRYLINNGRNASYTEEQLVKAKKQDAEYFVIEKLLQSKMIKNKKHYLVKWKDYPIADATWEPATQIIKDGAKRHIQAYNARNT